MKKKVKALSVSFASVAVACFVAVFLGMAGFTFMLNGSGAKGINDSSISAAGVGPIVTWAGNDGDGDGSELDPYIIKTASTFISRLRGDTNQSGDHSAGKYYVLMSDIDLSGEPIWTPIGNNQSYPFRGSFDGNGFTISGVKISGGTPAGLFGYVRSHTLQGGTYPGFVTTIKNFNLTNVDIYTTNSNPYSAGGVVANVLGYTSPRSSNAQVLLENIGLKKTTDYRDIIPYGLSASAPFNDLSKYSAYSSTVNSNGWSNNSGVTTTGNRVKGYAAGGIVGMSTSYSDVLIKGCYNEIMVESDSYFSGGIAGWSQGNAKVTVENCYNVGTVIGGSNSYTGGIFGLIEGTSEAWITDCYSMANIFGGDDTGGILGTCWSGSDKAWITRCFSVGGVYGHPGNNQGPNSSYKGGIIGYIGGGQVTVVNSFFVGTVSNGNTSGLGQGGTGGGVSLNNGGEPAQQTLENLFSEDFLDTYFGGASGAFVLLYDENGDPYIALKYFNHVGAIILDANGGWFTSNGGINLLANVAIDTSYNEGNFVNGIDDVNSYIYIKFDLGGNLDFDAIDIDGVVGYDHVLGVAFNVYIGEIITQDILNELNIAGWTSGYSGPNFEIPVGTANGANNDPTNNNIEQAGYVFQGWFKDPNPIQGAQSYGVSSAFVGNAVADSNEFVFYAKWRNQTVYTLNVDNTGNTVEVDIKVYYSGGSGDPILPKGDYVSNADTSRIGARPVSIESGYRYVFEAFYLYDAGGSMVVTPFGIAYEADATANLWMVDLGQVGTTIDSTFVSTYINGSEIKLTAVFNRVKLATFTVEAESGQQTWGNAEKQRMPAGAVEAISYGQNITYDIADVNNDASADPVSQVKIKAVAEQYYEFVGYRIGSEFIAIGANLTSVGILGDLTAEGFVWSGDDLIVGLAYMDGKQLVLVFAAAQYNIEFIAATENGGVPAAIGAGAPAITGSGSLSVGLGGDITGFNAGIIDGWRRAEKFSNLRIENQQDSGYDAFNTLSNGDISIDEISATFLDKYLDGSTIRIYVIYIRQYSLTINLDATDSDTKSGAITFKDFAKNTNTVDMSNLTQTVWFDEGDVVRLDIIPFSGDYQISTVTTLDISETLFNGRVNITIGNTNRTITVAFQKKAVDIEVRAVYIEEGAQVNIANSEFVGSVPYTTASTLTGVLSGQTVEVTRGVTNGYSFVGWRKLVNGNLVSLGNASIEIVTYVVNANDVSNFTNAVVLVQEFAKQYQLSITVEGEYEGVSDNASLYSLEMFIGEVQISNFNLSELAQNSTVKITITNPAYHTLNPIVGTAAGETTVNNPNGTHTVTIVINGSRDIVISFSPIIFGVSQNNDLSGARGTLNISTDEVKIGDSIVLSFIAESGYDFDSWKIGGANIRDIAGAQVSGDGKTVTFVVDKAFLDALLGTNGQVNLDSTVSTTINKGYLAGILVGVILVPLLVIGAVILAILNSRKKKEYAIALQKHKESSSRLGQADLIKNLRNGGDGSQGN